MQRAFEKEAGTLKYIDLRDFGDNRLNAILSALQFEYRLFLREMKGRLLPDEVPVDQVQTVLDFLCGPGTWCLDLGSRYPHMRIYGVDCNFKIILQAQENVTLAQMERVEFRFANREQPLLFPDGTFDFIHIQNGTRFLCLDEWPAILHELYRLLRPGGWLNLIDFEMGPTSQPALDRVLGFLGQMLVRLQRSNSPNGQLPFNSCTLGPHRLSEQGFTQVGYHLYPVNLGGWNNPIGRAYLSSIVVRPEMITNLAVETGVATPEELQPLLHEMQRELQQLGFCAAGMILSTFGQKPWAEAPA
jgi:ubiquinone/menaquinone biosynthesis C-methylase UbiE